MESKGKSRDISLFKYLGVLQREYLIAELRRKIYVKPKDKQYYERVMRFKREKIEDISERNLLPNIFDNTSEGEMQREQIFPNQGGYPVFIYRDESEKESYAIKDFENYYSPGSEVKVKSEGGFQVGVITDIRSHEVIEVKLKGESTPFGFPKLNVTRIL